MSKDRICLRVVPEVLVRNCSCVWKKTTRKLSIWLSVYQIVLPIMVAFLVTTAPFKLANSAPANPPHDAWYRKLSQVPLSNYPIFYHDTNINDYFAVFQKSKSEVANPKNYSEKYIYEAVGFFSGQVIAPIDLRKVETEFGFLRSFRSIRYSDGFKVEVRSLDSRPSGRCPQELNNYLRLQDPIGRTVKSRMVLYLLSESKETKVRENCASEQANVYMRSVVSLGSRIGPVLDDESFILSGPATDNDADVLVRLSRDLTIPRPCDVPNVIVVDLEDLPHGFGLEERNSRDLQSKMKEFFLARRNDQCQ